jgi:hypothetical protein
MILFIFIRLLTNLISFLRGEAVITLHIEQITLQSVGVVSGFISAAIVWDRDRFATVPVAF